MEIDSCRREVAFAGFTHQKAAPIWLPYNGGNKVLAPHPRVSDLTSEGRSRGPPKGSKGITYALAGLEMDLLRKEHISNCPSIPMAAMAMAAPFVVGDLRCRGRGQNKSVKRGAAGWVKRVA